MFTRKDKNTKYSNTFIVEFCEALEYTVLDIIQDGEVTVLLQDVERFEYYVKFRNLLANKVPRWKPTPHNVQLVCERQGVTFLESLSGLNTNTYKIRYSYDGRFFDRNFYALKEFGHRERLSLSTEVQEDNPLVASWLDGKRYVRGTCIHHDSFENLWVYGMPYSV